MTIPEQVLEERLRWVAAYAALLAKLADWVTHVDSLFDEPVQHDCQNKFKECDSVNRTVANMLKQPLVSPLKRRMAVVYTKNDKIPRLDQQQWVVVVPRVGCQRMLSGPGNMAMTFQPKTSSTTGSGVV